MKASLLSLDAMERLPYVCPWCLKWFKSPLSNHISSKCHEGHIFYQKYKELMDTNKPQFLAECSDLNLKGRGRNNIKAVELGDRPIIPARRSRDSKTHVHKLVWCLICRKPVAKKSYKENHLMSCAKKHYVHLSPEIKENLTKNVDTVVEDEKVAVARILKTLNPAIRGVLIDMRVDRLALTKFVAQDRVARALLTRMAFCNSSKFQWLQSTRKRLRLLFQILLYFITLAGDKIKEVTNIMVYDVYHANVGPQDLPAIIECCHAVCEKDELNSTFVKLNEVMTFSSLLQEVCDVIINQLHHPNNTRDFVKKEARELLAFLESDAWKMFTVRPAARQKNLLVKFQKVLVKPEDFDFYLRFVEDQSRENFASLQDAYAARNKLEARKAHGKLVESLPNAIGTFTYRRVSEPYQFTMADFLKRPNLDALLDDNAAQFSEKAKEQIKKVAVIESRGKGDNPVMSVVKVEWLEPMNVLCNKEFRKFIGLPEENTLVFGKLSSRGSLGHANPSTCQARFAKLCEKDVSNHLHLRTRNFRVTCATRLGGANLTHTTSKLICDLFGHTAAVHAKSYELPQPLKMAAYMGYVCHASADNKVSKLSATTIESQLDMVDNNTKPMEKQQE
jgi:hypothetical protein